MNHKPNSLPTIGLIGLGNLGNPMAVSAISNGYKMVVHSLNKNEATNLIALGAQWADTPAEVGASCDVVITVLPTPKHVREVMIGNGGVLDKMKRDSTFIDMSTSSADIANEIKTLADPRGIAVLEAPVSFLAKAPIGASRTSASLQIFVGGSKEKFDQHLPLFRSLGGLPEQIYYAGTNGAGYGIKVLLNLLWFIHAAGTAEILAIGSKLGLDLRVIQKALCASPTQSNFLQYDINSVFEAGNYDDGFTCQSSNFTNKPPAPSFATKRYSNAHMRAWQHQQKLYQ
ncbi:MAG: NAD(P)-dependent oxidoreductase [Acidimicrobiia bacterium]|nr:NAD(P)-dependent oxidoreductase [Acidimicrobiia bacterium]